MAYYSRLLLRVSEDLKREALNKERIWANGLIQNIERRNETEEYSNLLKLRNNPQSFLKNFFNQVLQEGLSRQKPEISLGNNKEDLLDFKKASYSIRNETYKLSTKRIEEMTEIAKKLLGSAQDTQKALDYSNFYTRISGLLWEEVGEKAINLGLDTIFGEDRTVILGKLHKSPQYQVDSKATIEIQRTKISSGIEYKNNIVLDEINFEHKNSLDNFHFGEENLIVRDENLKYLKRLSIDSGEVYLPDVYKSALLRKRLKGFYPIYYSVPDRSVLLTSEILDRPEGFYLTEPMEYSEAAIDRLAKRIYEEMEEDFTRPAFKQRLKDELSLEQEVFNALQEATVKVNMWYSRNRH